MCLLTVMVLFDLQEPIFEPNELSMAAAALALPYFLNFGTE
jgi:hypothetical protein